MPKVIIPNIDFHACQNCTKSVKLYDLMYCFCMSLCNFQQVSATVSQESILRGGVAQDIFKVH